MIDTTPRPANVIHSNDRTDNYLFSRRGLPRRQRYATRG
jgi:hypothetical protein